MFSEKDLKIPFAGLNEGKHQFNFKLGDEFFKYFEYGLIDRGNVNLNLTLEKMSAMMVLHFDFSGQITTECDNCLEDLNVMVFGKNKMYVKFGDFDYEETEEIIVLSRKEFELDIRHYIYEFISLSLPARKIHPEGECDPDMAEKRKSMEVNKEESETDPRWEALKKLKNN